MIRERAPDLSKSRSMMNAAERKIFFIKKLSLTEESAPVIITECYDSFRMLGDALMLARGKEAVKQGHHRTVINELLLTPVRTERQLSTLLNIQELRRKIQYEGYQPTKEHAETTLDFTNTCFPPLLEAVKKELKK